MDENKTSEVMDSANEGLKGTEDSADEALKETEDAAEKEEDAAEKEEDAAEKEEDAAGQGETHAVSEEEINKLARHYRHIGFAIFGGLAALLSLFLIYVVVTGYQKGEVYDPFTGEVVVAEQRFFQTIADV